MAGAGVMPAVRIGKASGTVSCELGGFAINFNRYIPPETKVPKYTATKAIREPVTARLAIGDTESAVRSAW
jgi:hypothetical protein